MAYLPTPAGPKGLRQLYHWIWGELRRVSSSVILGQLEDVTLNDPSSSRDIIEYYGTITYGDVWTDPPTSIGGAWTDLGGGVYSAAGVGANNLAMAGITVNGTTYRITFTIDSATGSGFVVRVGTSNYGGFQNALGVHTIDVTATADGDEIGIRCNSNEDGGISSVSVLDLSDATVDAGWVSGRRTRYIQEGYVVGNEYQRGDEVSNWQQISEALVDGTSQYPYVTPTGAEFGVYTGTMGETSDVVKQVIFGNRYTFGASGYLTGYSVYAVIGNSYSIFSVRDPDGERIVTELLAFVAESNGWVTLGIPSIIVTEGVILDVMTQVQEPAATPVVWVGNWNYTTPNNEGTPATGAILQADKNPSSLRINKTDNDSGDRGAELEALTSGDKINGAGVSWIIQASVDNGTWMDFAVAPGVAGSPDGVQEFSFETVVATPIVYGEDIDWWINNPPANGSVQGMLSVGGAYDDIIPDGNAYGVDITVQNSYVPTDWQVKVIAGGATGGASYRLNAKQYAWVSESATTVDEAYVSTTNQQWTEIYRETVPDNSISDGYALIGAKRTDSLDAYRCKLESLAWRDTGPLEVDDKILYEIGSSLLNVRARADGNDIVFQVRGRNSQDWNWKLLLFFEGR